MDTKLILLIIALITLGGIVFYFLSRAQKKQKEIVEPTKTFEQNEIKYEAELRYEYSSALQSGDKEKALALGKKYYQSLRGAESTNEDEQAIFDDLSKMKIV